MEKIIHAHKIRIINVMLLGNRDKRNEELRAVIRKIWKRINPRILDQVLPPTGSKQITLNNLIAVIYFVSNSN